MHTTAAQADAGAEGSTKLGWGKFLTAAAATTAVGGLGFALAEDEAEHGLHAPQYPWPHSGWFSSYDHAAIRRGHQVYSQVHF